MRVGWSRSSMLLALLAISSAALAGDSRSPRAEYRSPVDLALTADGRLLTVNQTAGSVSLVDVDGGKVLDEAVCGAHPTAIALTPDNRRAIVVASYAGELALFRLEGKKLASEGRISVGFEPYGIAVADDGKTAYVTQSAGSAVAVVDLGERQIVDRIDVGPWPRFLALSPDGKRLAVGCNGDQSVWVVDTTTRKVLFSESTGGINLGQMQISDDGQYVYLPWMVYRENPINPANIRKGWVLGTRIGRLRMDTAQRREAITLDPPGMAVADPHGFAITPDRKWLVSAAGGTHELLLFRADAVKFQAYGGPGDHIDPRLLYDRSLFARVPLGGRPLCLRIDAEGKRAYVVNYLSDSIQVVDLDERKVTDTIHLGSSSETTLARRGEAIFYDGRRSLDQWYSCNSCHWEAGPNAVTMDTKNDRTERTFKTVPALANVSRTGPWTWHGWQKDLNDAMRTSLTETMEGPEPSEADCEALVAYLDSLSKAPNPYAADPKPSAAVERGRIIFAGETAGCIACHRGPEFTDGEIHDVGTGREQDAFDGYNTPSLVGVHRRVRLLHDGRARSLEALLAGPHAPENVTGNGKLTDDERRDLIEYLKTL